MTATVEDFDALNEFEFHKEMSLHGIPDGQRREAWLLLLAIEPTPTLIQQDSFYSKQTKGQVERYCKQRQLKIQDLMVNTISSYLSQSHSQYSSHLVPLAGPICIVFQQDSIPAFTTLMSRIGTTKINPRGLAVVAFIG